MSLYCCVHQWEQHQSYLNDMNKHGGKKCLSLDLNAFSEYAKGGVSFYAHFTVHREPTQTCLQLHH